MTDNKELLANQWEVAKQAPDQNLEKQQELVAKQAELDKLKTDIEKAQDVKKQAEIFADAMDTYGLDVLVGLIPAAGDGASSIVSAAFFMRQAKKLDLGAKAYVKIGLAQVADFLVSLIPVVGDIADYFFKANKRSAKIFAKELEKLQATAKEKGMTEEEMEKLAELESDGVKFMKKMDSYYKDKNISDPSTTA